jgi:hypothetical protein
MVTRTTAPDPAPAEGANDPKGMQSSLSALADEAASTLDPAPPEAANEASAAAPAMTNAQCLMMGAQMIRGTLESVANLKSPAVTMADEKLQPAADALGAVFDKHGWNLQGLAGDHMLEIAALLTVAPLAWAAYQGIQAELKASKKAKPAAEPAPEGEQLAADTAPGAPAVFAKNDPRSVTLNGG